jgi:hypothetical protein
MASRVRNFLRRYGFLMIVYVPALSLAALEMHRRLYQDGAAPDAESAKLQSRYSFEYAKLFEEIYPESPRSESYKGLSALLNEKNPQKAREHFESALATGFKSDEQLLYYYALTLVLLKEDPEKINAAVRTWRVNFPKSALPDPRTVRRYRKAPSQ